MENSELKIASHHNFYNATLYVKCEEKDGAIYWYGDNSDNLKKITTRTTRGCGRISRYVGNHWKRISKKAAAEILAKYGITAEQFIAYTNEEPELMSELAAQRAEEERVETLNFFLSLPLTSNGALEVATDAEIELVERNAKIELDSNSEVIAEDDGSNDDPDEDEMPAISVATNDEEDDDELIDTPEIAAQEKISADTTPYHVEIKMYGNKTPMFEILRDGRNIFSKRGGYTFRKREVNEWVMKAYQMRKRYPNMTIELPEVVAALHLDSFACNPRIVRELNVTLTGMTDYELTQIEQYNKFFELTDRDRKVALNFFLSNPLTSNEALEVATNAEIALATKAAVKQSETDLPSGDITVESGAEAFALVAKYFPSGLEFDGNDYGYRGETHFCFFNDSADLSLIALSDESNRRIEEVRVQEGGNIRLAVIIEPKKNVDKPLVKTSNVEKTAEKKKAADDAEKNLKTSQKTVATDKSQRWLENAKTDVAGRYYIVPELAYKNFEANANWNPCFYIVTNEFKLKRVGLKFVVALATLGQAIEISKNDVAALKK